MSIPINQYPSIEQMTGRIPVQTNQKPSNPNQVSSSPFSEILKSKQVISDYGELRFSKHANHRLASRNINLTVDQLERLESGAKKAEEKGIKESLVMVDNLAFIVNIANNTVITAMNDEEEKIFTNIDGAVIV